MGNRGENFKIRIHAATDMKTVMTEHDMKARRNKTQNAESPTCTTPARIRFRTHHATTSPM